MKCKFCKGNGKAEYFDMVICEKTCGSKKICHKGFDCEIASGVDLCPDCNGTGKEKLDISKN
jgi:DnaJ-class molecular chaperone